MVGALSLGKISMGMVFSATTENNIRPRKITKMVIGLLNAIGIIKESLFDGLYEQVQIAIGRRLIQIGQQPVAYRLHILGLGPVQDKAGVRQVYEVDDARPVLRGLLRIGIL